MDDDGPVGVVGQRLGLLAFVEQLLQQQLFVLQLRVELREQRS